MLLWIAVLFTNWHVEARKFLWANNKYQPCNAYLWGYTYDYTAGSFTEISNDYSEVNDLNYYNNGTRYYSLNGNVSWNLQTVNDWDYWSCNNYVYHDYANYYYVTRYNFIKVFKDSTTADFYVRNDVDNVYRHVSTPSIWYAEDWVSFDMWFPRHGTIVLYDSLSWHTIQLIWKHTLYDKVVYVDTLESDQNFWVINFNQKKAWSTHFDMTEDFWSMYLFWKRSDDATFFSTLEDTLDNSYTLSSNGTYFWPNTVSQYNINDNRTQRSTETNALWLSFVYSSDLNFVRPDFWYEIEHWSAVNTWSAYNSWSNERYNLCLNRGYSIRTASLYQKSCINTIDGEHTTYSDYMDYYNYVKNYSGTGTYTGVMWSQSCYDWINYETWQFSYWGANYSLYFNYASDRANTEPIDIEAYCSQYKVEVSSEQSWTCKYLWIGCSDDTTLWYAYDYVKWMIKPFWDETLGELINSYNSGYNYINVPTCSSDYYWKSYGWANTAFMVLVAFLVFQLYNLFKN